MKKRILSIVLVLALLVTLLNITGLTAFAEEEPILINRIDIVLKITSEMENVMINGGPIPNDYYRDEYDHVTEFPSILDVYFYDADNIEYTPEQLQAIDKLKIAYLITNEDGYDDDSPVPVSFLDLEYNKNYFMFADFMLESVEKIKFDDNDMSLNVYVNRKTEESKLSGTDAYVYYFSRSNVANDICLGTQSEIKKLYEKSLEEESTHTHCVCGKESCSEHGGAAEYQSLQGEVDGSTLPAGKYYLAGDVTLTSAIVNYVGDYSFCLNGYKMNVEEVEGVCAFGVKKLTICDCSEAHTGELDIDCSVVNQMGIVAAETVDIYGGTVNVGSEDCDSAIYSMGDIKISGSDATLITESYGIGIRSHGKLTISAGTVTANGGSQAFGIDGGIDLSSYENYVIKAGSEAEDTDTISTTTENWWLDYNYINVTRNTPALTGVSAVNVEETYDGNEHSIMVDLSGEAVGATIIYGETEGDYDLNESPRYKNAGTRTVYYKVTKEGFKDYTGSATVTINRKAVGKDDADVTLGNILVENGEEQTQEVKSVKVGGEEVAFTVSGNSATDHGTYEMTITLTGNYEGEFKHKFVVVSDDDKDVENIGDGSVKVKVQTDINAPKAEIENSNAEMIQMLLTADELSAVANGDNANVWLEVTDVTNSISDEAKRAITNGAKDYELGQFIDISLFKKLDSQAEATQIHETGKKVKITITIPDSLLTIDEYTERTFFVVRNHDGEITVIEGVFDKEAKTFTFETDRFSDYAIIYKDVVSKPATEQDGTKQGNTEQSKSEQGSKTSPKTGDTSNSALWILFLCFSGAALTVTTLYGIKKRATK